MVSTNRSDASSLTIPEAGHRLHQAPTRSGDRHAFSPDISVNRIPIRACFIKRFVHRFAPGIHGTLFRWHVRVDESFPGAFDQWQIALPPGEHLRISMTNLSSLARSLAASPCCFAVLFRTALSGDHKATSEPAAERVHSCTPTCSARVTSPVTSVGALASAGSSTHFFTASRETIFKAI
jgi:hypothetical protein